MKLGIMQPYFFPYIGYFQLLNYVDKWVVFDDIQFVNKGWVNRNRILHPDIKKQWQYFTIPLKKRGRFDKINSIEINADIKWKSELLGKLTYYKKKAPYYNKTIDLVNSCLACEHTNLSYFIINTMRHVASMLEITTEIELQSELSLELAPVEHPGQWALNISDKLGAAEYINPNGGHAIFNNDEFKAAGIQLKFLKSKLCPYDQRRDEFISGLSIIDILMWNDISEIKKMLERDFSLLNKEEIESE